MTDWSSELTMELNNTTHKAMDSHRPTYHLMPHANWMNDPNGPLYYNGEYHLFYQYNPFGNQWGSIHWGHASSADLVRWRHWPVALRPSPSLGEEHCFSGSAVLCNGIPTILYTSVGREERNSHSGAEQWMATSHDGMVTWEKYQGNPVMTNAIHGDMMVLEWRDPFVWQENGVWYMVLGGKHADRGCALIYRSTNLTEWEFLNKLMEEPGETWECPNLFRLGDHHVLVYSPLGPVRYHVGALNADFTFTGKQSGWIDHGGFEGYYATNSIVDEQSRRIMWGWIPEAARGEFRKDCEWAGVQSLPRVITLGPDDLLGMHPLPELTLLRNRHWHEENLVIFGQGYLSDATGRALEIVATMEIPSPDSSFHLKVLSSLETGEETVITFHADTRQFTFDRSKSSLSDLPHKSSLTATSPILENMITLHVFVDHSVVEVFINYRECITTRVYPISDDAVHVALCGDADQTLRVKSLDVWQLTP